MNLTCKGRKLDFEGRSRDRLRQSCGSQSIFICRYLHFQDFSVHLERKSPYLLPGDHSTLGYGDAFLPLMPTLLWFAMICRSPAAVRSFNRCRHLHHPHVVPIRQRCNLHWVQRTASRLLALRPLSALSAPTITQHVFDEPFIWNHP